MSENHSHKNFKRPRNDRNTAPQQDADDGMDEQEDWNPSREQMNQYLVREVALAQSNILLVLSRARYPHSFKELRDSTLHTSETVEQALTSHIASGKVKEALGRFTIA